VKPAVRQVKLVLKLYGGTFKVFVKSKEHRIVVEEREMCFCSCRYVVNIGYVKGWKKTGSLWDACKYESGGPKGVFDFCDKGAIS